MFIWGSSMSKIVSTLELVSTTSRTTREACFRLLAKHFAGVTWEQFQNDFLEKKYVAILRREGVVVGFSTMVTVPVYDRNHILHQVAFSGDTAVEFDARNSIGFGTALSSFFKENISEYGDGNVWYILISKGWRTYKAMEFMFHSFAPCPTREILTEEKEIVSAFAKMRYPSRFDEEGLVLRSYSGDQRLSEGSPDLVVPDSMLGNFFVDKNPNFAQGDELICIANISHANFTRAFQRCFR